jgi:hypothetical protein
MIRKGVQDSVLLTSLKPSTSSDSLLSLKSAVFYVTFRSVNTEFSCFVTVLLEHNPTDSLSFFILRNFNCRLLSLGVCSFRYSWLYLFIY